VFFFIEVTCFFQGLSLDSLEPETKDVCICQVFVTRGPYCKNTATVIELEP